LINYLASVAVTGSLHVQCTLLIDHREISWYCPSHREISHISVLAVLGGTLIYVTSGLTKCT